MSSSFEKRIEKWRVCIDFTDLNKACPKYPFPLLHIGLMVNATVRFELLSFMDANLGYNLILMQPIDPEKKSFYYRTRNLLLGMFKEKLGKTEVYINDMLVKSHATELHVEHLKKIFETLRQYNI